MSESRTDEPILVSVKEAARLLGVSPWNVYQLLGNDEEPGALPSRYIGRRRLILKADLDSFVSDLPTARDSA